MGIVIEIKFFFVFNEGLIKVVMMVMFEYEDWLLFGLVSLVLSFYSKEYDNEGIVDYSEILSFVDFCFLSFGVSGFVGKFGDSGDWFGQKCFCIQMINLQLKVFKLCFNDYRIFIMLECEVLGNDIGLLKRVVQVWFQNVWVKEKKFKLSMVKYFGIN